MNKKKQMILNAIREPYSWEEIKGLGLKSIGKIRQMEVWYSQKTGEYFLHQGMWDEKEKGFYLKFKNLADLETSGKLIYW